MKWRLKQDIVIKAGTIFDSAPTETRRVGDGHAETIIGLTKNSYGSLVYSIEDKEELKDWFEEEK